MKPKRKHCREANPNTRDLVWKRCRRLEGHPGQHKDWADRKWGGVSERPAAGPSSPPAVPDPVKVQ